VEDPDFRVAAVPIAGDGVEDQPEIALGSGDERFGGHGLKVDIRVTGADELERLGFVLGDLVGRVAEKDLDGDGRDGVVPGIGDVAIDVGDFASGEVRGLAHDEAGDGEAGGVGIEGSRDRGDGDRLAAMLEGEDDSDCEDDDDAGGNGEGSPVAFAGFGAGDQLDFGTRFHVRILHPLLKESLLWLRYRRQPQLSAMIAEEKKQKHR